MHTALQICKYQPSDAWKIKEVIHTLSFCRFIIYTNLKKKLTQFNLRQIILKKKAFFCYGMWMKKISRWVVTKLSNFEQFQLGQY